MYRLFIACLILIAGLTVSGCSRASAPSNAQASKPYAGYVLPAPDGWKASDRLGKGVEVLYLGPDQGGFEANINLMVQSLPAKLDLAGYTDITLKQMSAAKGKVISEKDVTISDLPGHQIVWTATMANRPLEFLSQYVIRGDKAVLFTGTSLESKYSEVAPVFEASAASLQLK